MYASKAANEKSNETEILDSSSALTVDGRNENGTIQNESWETELHKKQLQKLSKTTSWLVNWPEENLNQKDKSKNITETDVYKGI